MEKVQAGTLKTSKGIYGRIIDDEGRCVHYGSIADIIANRCSICGKLYACYKCHDELEDHKFGAVRENEADSVMCGVCGTQFSYITYSGLSKCPSCGSLFNPRCALHKNCYAKQSNLP
ncbi:MAG: hypothetical protein K6G00_10065 [Treponema sp.]|nr:hypothetical protein [Treponema sp.]